jgi:hypothetical protein
MALTDIIDIRGDLYKAIKGYKWPLYKADLAELAPGMDIDKQMTIHMNERVYNTIERHVKLLKVNRSMWIRFSLLKTIKEEQLYCNKINHNGENDERN